MAKGNSQKPASVPPKIGTNIWLQMCSGCQSKSAGLTSGAIARLLQIGNWYEPWLEKVRAYCKQNEARYK
jgi:hypothetical protein